MPKSSSGVWTNRYRNGTPAKSIVPAKSHQCRPQRSERIPTAGLSTIPVIVETETINPSNVQGAPNLAAKIGRIGVLPIWYADLTMKSATVILIKLWRCFIKQTIKWRAGTSGSIYEYTKNCKSSRLKQTYTPTAGKFAASTSALNSATSALISD